MSLYRPRRIFRSASPPRRALPVRALLAVFSGLAVTGAAVAVAAFGASNLFGGAPASVARIITANPEAVAVAGGDTLVLGETAVRLRGVAAPPRGTACHEGNHTVDCGVAAVASLVGLLHNRAVSCRLHGVDEMGRPLGDCAAQGRAGSMAGDTDLNRAIVAAGWARATDSALKPAESKARSAHLGLWAGQGRE